MFLIYIPITHINRLLLERLQVALLMNSNAFASGSQRNVFSPDRMSRSFRLLIILAVIAVPSSSLGAQLDGGSSGKFSHCVVEVRIAHGLPGFEYNT